MFRYRMSSKPARSGWIVLVVIIGVLLLILATQFRSPQTVSSSLPSTTENSAVGAGGVVMQLWQDLKAGVTALWSKLTGQNQAKPVNVDLDSSGIVGAGDDEDDVSGGDVSVVITNPQKPEAFVPQGTSPQILIYHTHSHESYSKQDGQDYVETAQWRTTNNNFNVARVGEELAQLLYSKYGIAVLHDTTDNEYPQLGTAYSRSLKTVQKDMADNPDLKILIDLHRDAFNASINPSTVTINGVKVARIMLVIGTGVGQTGVGFTEKPDWHKNVLLANAITDKLKEFDPQLARPVDIKTGRYNQHVSPGAILIEVGHNENTLDEVLAAVPYLAQAIADVYGELGATNTLVTASPTVSPANASPSPSASPGASSSAPVRDTPITISSPLPSASATPQVITLEPVTTASPTATP